MQFQSSARLAEIPEERHRLAAELFNQQLKISCSVLCCGGEILAPKTAGNFFVGFLLRRQNIGLKVWSTEYPLRPFINKKTRSGLTFSGLIKIHVSISESANKLPKRFAYGSAIYLSHMKIWDQLQELAICLITLLDQHLPLRQLDPPTFLNRTIPAANQIADVTHH